MTKDDQAQPTDDQARRDDSGGAQRAPLDGASSDSGAAKQATEKGSTTSRPRGTTEDPDRTL